MCRALGVFWGWVESRHKVGIVTCRKTVVADKMCCLFKWVISGWTILDMVYSWVYLSQVWVLRCFLDWVFFWKLNDACWVLEAFPQFPFGLGSNRIWNRPVNVYNLFNQVSLTDSFRPFRKKHCIQKLLLLNLLYLWGPTSVCMSIVKVQVILILAFTHVWEGTRPRSNSCTGWCQCGLAIKIDIQEWAVGFIYPYYGTYFYQCACLYHLHCKHHHI